MPETNLDIARVAQLLQKHNVRYVAVGGMAVYLYGGETPTMDIDLAFELGDENLNAMADALQEMKAVPTRWNSPNYRLARTDLATAWLHLSSQYGEIDLLTKTPGVESFGELDSDKNTFLIEGHPFFVASIHSLIKMKSNTNRPRDARHVEELKGLLASAEKDGQDDQFARP